MTDHAPLEAWPDALQRTCDGLVVLRRALVVRETPTTQDVARAHSLGDVVVAWRQTAGRGRHGRVWADTGEAGVALTAVVPAVGSWLSIAAGVAAARAMQAVAPSLPIGLKWPNDVMIGTRKAGGVLIEVDGARALVGIGLNAGRVPVDPSIEGRVTSVAAEGINIDRLVLACAVLRALDASIVGGASRAIESFRALDMLGGRRLRVRHGANTLEGTAVDIDPLHSMTLIVDGAERRLGLDHTIIESFE